MSKQIVTLIIGAALVLGVAAAASGQRHALVPVDEPVYRLLESAEMRGMLDRLPRVRPYSERRIAEYLDLLWARRGRLSGAERAVLSRYRERYSAAPAPPATFRATAGADLRAELDAVDEAHVFTTMGLELMGDVGEHFSYRGGFLYHLQRINPDAWAPYRFTRQWDGIRIGITNFEHDEDIEELNQFMSLSHSVRPDVAVSFFDGDLELRWAKVRREWGHGEGSLELSAEARPADGIGMFLSPTDWIYIDYLTASLGDWTDREVEQKMLSIHGLEVFPADWLSLSLFEAVVWGKRFEPGYLNPFGVYIVTQHQIGDLDNLLPGGAARVRFAPWGSWYASFFVDGIPHTKFDGIFTDPNNMFAYQSGVKLDVPWLPFATAAVQYTKVEPYMYTHYPQEYPFFTNSINTAYTHDGENVGFYLPPNSDEILFGLTTLPRPGLRLSASYRLIRHGDNPDADEENRKIGGDIDKWLDYGDLGSYPDKDFLNDGTYEWINVVSLEADWSVPGSGLSLWGEYSFSHALNWENERGATLARNALGLGFAYSYDFLPLFARDEH
ncbi:MAG: hypothetical protein ACLFUX_09135 [Spirochaetaceae bacterium]